METLQEVKKTIEFNQRFKTILEVLKSVAIAQFYALEKKMASFEAFDNAISQFFSELNFSGLPHPFLAESDGPKAVVAVTSDHGLLGGLNMNVVTGAVGLMNTDKDQLFVVGEQGKIFSQYHKVSFVAFPGIDDEKRYYQATQLRDYLFKEIKKGKYTGLKVVYARANSLVSQKVEVVTLLPLALDQAKSKETIDPSQIIFESTLPKILEYLAFLRIGQSLNDVFGYSRLAELGARYNHLEESSHKIEDLNKKLKLKYFRLRHEAIDASMRELFSARLLYADE